MGEAAIGNVLVVDDEASVAKATELILRQAGFKVATATSGNEAMGLLERNGFDCIVSDINMPGMNGFGLLRMVRARDLDVPVILMTGAPTETSASDAVAYGALRCLMKPVEPSVLARQVVKATRLGRLARVKREALDALGGPASSPGDRAGLEGSFGRALETLWMAYQPIVRKDGTLFAYEALVRSSEPTIPHPGALFDAAERLDRLVPLGRMIREKCAEPIVRTAPDVLLFVNLHPRDLLDEQLLSVNTPLGRIAERVVLEITERAALNEIRDAAQRVASLRSLGYRIAIDDLGAGYAGLTSFANLDPEIAKLDMSIVRDVDKNPKRRKIIESMSRLCKEMGILIVAEGVETVQERDILVECGCDLLQGYLIAKPGKPFPEPRWT